MELDRELLELERKRIDPKEKYRDEEIAERQEEWESRERLELEKFKLGDIPRPDAEVIAPINTVRTFRRKAAITK